MTKRRIIILILSFLLVCPLFSAADNETVTTEEAATADVAGDIPVPENPEASETAADSGTVEGEALSEGNSASLAFDEGYRLFSKDRFSQAAPYFYRYVSENTTAADDYDWAEFFLGISLMKSGFSHAAVDELSWLVSRKPNTRIVSYILELFEEISRSQPYDREKVIEKAICDQEYGFVDKKLNDFINYHQGVFDWKNGFDEWGDKHFSKITPGSYYHYKFRYQQALYDISRDEIDEAVKALEEINAAEFDGEDLKNEVRKTLARMMYEKGEYQSADDLYSSISNNIIYQAQNLLERSWTQYRMRHQEKAMGLLYAFKAPVYRNYFTPEYFLLKSFIYKDVCHYQRALAVIDEFRDHYGEALEAVYGRSEITENQPLLLALLGNRKIKDLWNFLRLLDDERVRIETVEDPALKAHLEKIYGMASERSRREFRLMMEDKYEDLANDLLEYEEKADLMAYEVGLDMYQRVYQYHYTEDTPSKETEPQAIKHYQAFYPFQGEFWNDELNAYKVTLEDKCACMEEWDIFFK